MNYSEIKEKFFSPVFCKMLYLHLHSCRHTRDKITFIFRNISSQFYIYEFCQKTQKSCRMSDNDAKEVNDGKSRACYHHIRQYPSYSSSTYIVSTAFSPRKCNLVRKICLGNLVVLVTLLPAQEIERNGKFLSSFCRIQIRGYNIGKI